MAAPVIQLKRGLLANLPGLKGGEPGFTTDSYDLYVGLDETTTNNKLIGSGRYWSVNSATKGSGVNLVEGTNNGTSFLTLKSPDSLAGIVTFVMPGTDGNANDILKTDGAGNLSFAAPASSSFTIAADSGTDDTFNTGETLTFAGTANEIETTVSDNQIQIGLPNDVTVGGGLTATTFTLAGVAVTAILDEDTFASDRADALATQQSIKAYVDANETHIDNLVSLSGVSKDTTNLGTFTGSTITDSRNIKEALQDLETSLEQVSGGGASATSVAVARTDANSTHYLTFVDGNNATKTQEDIQTDAGVTYNPSTNILSVGEISATTLDIGGTNVTSTAAELNVLSGVTAFVDEDNMASDSATSIPSQQSVKAYVDSQVGAVDVEFGTAGDSGTGTVNTSQSLTVSGTANEIVTSASGQGITIALPDDVTIGQDLTVTRNLIVNGSTTQVNVENMTVDDPLVSVGTTSGNAPGADFGKDLGILMHYYSSGAAKLASVYWDNSASRMVMASVVTETSAGSNVLTATTRATVEIGSLMLSDAAGTGESVITTSGSDRVLENITVDCGSF